MLYNKTYCIHVNTNNVYEIKIQTSDTYGLKTKIITDVKDIKGYMNKVRKFRFTHPRFHTGKGFITAVAIKMKDKRGNQNLYQYTILNDRISIGAFQYKIISE